MQFESRIKEKVIAAIKEVFASDADMASIAIQPTRKDFEGDITVVTFPLTKLSKKSPEETGKLLGEKICDGEFFTKFNVVKGFLNISVSDDKWLKMFFAEASNNSFGIKTKADGNPLLVEYSSPNTNKPLHLGHVRNNLLGFSVAELLKATGRDVKKVSIVNDRGIHICKSMLAWQLFGNGETPESSGIKGDHLVGKYYVEFDKEYIRQANENIENWQKGIFSSDEIKNKYQTFSASLADEKKTDEAKEKINAELKDFAKAETKIFKDAQQMLRLWEAGDKEIVALWKKMNQWVYDGFDVTYKMLGVDFDKFYYESQTYLLGKEIVQEGLRKNVFYKKEDGSVWIDLKEINLDEKLVLRKDGTSVYMTQDIGTALLRYEEFHFNGITFVVANEQDYHFKVLFFVLKKLGYNWANNLHHLNYAMVDLPSGKMKSREGTVVDADELMQEMIAGAEKITRELGKIDELSQAEAKKLFYDIGMGALKYFILKVDPEKRMLFNPEESIDFNGNTGPFIQYTHARICSLLRRASQIKSLKSFSDFNRPVSISPIEKELIKNLLQFEEIVADASKRFSPAIVANYVFDLAKTYNRFYHEHAVIDESNLDTSLFRLQLSKFCASNLKNGLKLLGINAPEKM